MEMDQEHYKESLDRCLCVSKIINEVLLCHPTIEHSLQASHLITGAKSAIDAVAQLLKANAINNDGIMDDRAYCLFIIVNELLVNNFVIATDKKALEIAQEVADKLWILYQHLGK